MQEGKKQIQYLMYLQKMRPTSHAEIEQYWGKTNFGRWRYIADCFDPKLLKTPFNIEDIIGSDEAAPYKNLTPAMKIHKTHENDILNYLRDIHAI